MSVRLAISFLDLAHFNLQFCSSSVAGILADQTSVRDFAGSETIFWGGSETAYLKFDFMY